MPDSSSTDIQPIHPAPRSFWRRAVFSTDHKVIARQFLGFGLVFMLLGGVMALLIRWQLGYPGEPVPAIGRWLFPQSHGAVTPTAYAALFTMHGTIMIFFAVTPILIGAYGNFCIPLLIGARDMAFPKLNMLSFWTQMIAGLILVVSFFVPLGPAMGGWTSYPPLSSAAGQPGGGETLWTLALFVAGCSTLMGAINYITTIIRFRAPGMGYFRMPLTVWGLWLTAILNALFVPVVASALLLLFLDRVFGSTFFEAGLSVQAGGDPVVYQHLFWIFGHPEVYILILPAWGLVSDLLSFFARKPAFGARRTALSMTAIATLSGIVWGHHMYTVGLTPLLAGGFMTLTFLISIPSAILFLNWLGTLWGGSIRFQTPMLFALGVVFVFGMGGLTGLHLATITTDFYLHDTYFVVGHFHLTMAAAVLLASFAAIYYWFPKMFGRRMNEALGTVHFFGTLVPLTFVFVGMLFLGYGGHPRRLFDPGRYEYLRHLMPLNHAITVVALWLGAFQLVFVYNFFESLVAGEVASDNPWEVPTLEWTIHSPPPPHNFDVIPHVLRGPHVLGRPDLTGRDFLAQDEPEPRAAPAEPLTTPSPAGSLQPAAPPA
ncbi:MAG TPA: cbb3-type cytochrome c oxidase subunit I [Myxococcales bacterium]|nr:cbb3-type cytochrome c oxidase subunit I [Myxococcales bacterium]